MRNHVKILIVAGLLLIVSGVASKADVDPPTEGRPHRAQPPGLVEGTPPATASDVASEPGFYYGKEVRLRSQVYQIFGRHAFTLTDEPFLAAPDVLVLVPYPLATPAEDYRISVVGIARPFDRRELEREFPWFKTSLFGDAGLLERWHQDKTPVIIASSVRTEDGMELVQVPSKAKPAGAAVGAAPSSQSGQAQGSREETGR